jgi:TolA-binding protein
MLTFLFFQFICDNYTEAVGPSNTSPVVSHSARAASDVCLDDCSCVNSMHQELADLQQQLPAMKKQVVTIMDQSRKSSDREQAALRQEKENLELKESTIGNASRATKRENYMLDLMTDASQDMAGMLCCGLPLLFIFFVSLLKLCCFSCAVCRYFS